jgi:hypothetical protein
VPTARFTRDELHAAEPERHPSARRRWLIGLGLGALAFGLLSFEGIAVLTLLCLPFATTPAGAGALVGAGVAWLTLFAWGVVLWVNGDLAASPILAAWWLAGLAALVAGLLGTAVAFRAARATGPARRTPSP